jgi:integration host factor subunit beta
MKTYIKKDLVERVGDLTGQRQHEVARTVDALFVTLREWMENACPECRVEIREFGVFEVKTTKPKPQARNPRTNEVVYVPARRKTHFRPGKQLKEALHRPLDVAVGEAAVAAAAVIAAPADPPAPALEL